MKNRHGEKINIKYNLRIYWGMLKKYKLAFFGILLLILILNALNVLNSFLFKVIVDEGTKFAAGEIALTAFVGILGIVALVYAGKVTFSGVGHWFQLHSINRLDSNLMADLKRKFFNHIVRLDHEFHTSHKTGSLISRLTRGRGAIERMTDVTLFNIAPLLFSLIVVGGSLMYFNWIPALVVVLTVVAFVGYSFLIQHLQQGASLEENRMEDIEKANIGDVFTNIDSIKYFGKEKNIIEKFKRISENSKKAAIRHWDYFRWFDAGQTIILGVGIFFLLYFPLMSFLEGEVTMGTLVFIYTVYGNLIGPLYGFIHGMRGFYRSMADFDALFEYGKVERGVKDKLNAKSISVKEGEVEFRGISFSYGKRNLFKNFSLKIPKNKKLALVGHSGCGKTTLVNLLYRFYDVDDGAILIDGEDIRSFKQESLREEMSIVPQECVLFDDSIYNNIAFSKPGAKREEVVRAMKFAQLDKFVKSLPKKEKTIVGERGVKLSGGEKQRVSIARAILANKKILILDEATSSLDSLTEYEIQNDLEKLMEGRTSIIIAHRLSTIMRADMIVVMKESKIVQMGTHDELIKQKGEYRDLWNMQKGGYIK